MSLDEKENVNANSAEFKRGVEAGLNSEEDTKNWKAGNELGRELKGHQPHDAVAAEEGQVAGN